MLDFPLLSMVSLALCGLVTWHKYPNWKTATFAGIFLSGACLTKQTAAFYLIGPCALLLTLYLKRKQYYLLKQLIYIAAITGVPFGLWYAANYTEIAKIVSGFQTYIAKRSPAEMFFSDMYYYLTALPSAISPLLCLTSLLALLDKRIHSNKLLALPALSTSIGIFILCLLPFQLPEQRYLLPALPLFAFVLASFASKLIHDQQIYRKILSFALIAISLLQFFSDNYTPTIFCSDGLKKANYEKAHIPGRYPTPGGDPWRQEWIVRTIFDAQPKNSSCWVNLIPNTIQLNVHMLEAVAVSTQSPVKFSTFRLWTGAGDKFEFKETQAQYFDWFIVSNGDQGTPLFNKESKLQYKEALNYIEKSGKFLLYAKNSLPDGHSIILYRRKSSEAQ